MVEYAHVLAPPEGGGGERQNVTTLSRWATDPAVAARRPLIVLLAPAAGDVSAEIHAGASGAEVVDVPRPALEDRVAFAEELRERWPEVAWELTPAELGGGDGRALARAGRGHGPARPRRRARRSPAASILERKIDLLRQEYGDVLEILQPRNDLSAVGGLDHAVSRAARDRGHHAARALAAAPLGIILMGPPGTGKSYLAECFAKECGMLCVKFRPLRGMYVGQSERNQEKAFAAIRALAPVVVIVDESDQAEGGSRDQGSGDSGVTERMRAGAFNFWADNALRGKVLRIDSTNRVDLIDSAMRRSGRTDVKIPVLMPDETARRQIFEVLVTQAQARLHHRGLRALRARAPTGSTGSRHRAGRSPPPTASR